MGHGSQTLRARSQLVTLGIVLSLSLLTTKGRARDREPDYQQWLQVQLDLKLPQRWLSNLDLQARRLNAPLNAIRDASGQVVGYEANPNTAVLLRPSLGYAIYPFLSAWLGYAYTPTLFDTPAVRDAKNISEHRLFEQLSATFNVSRVALSARLRVEQRVRSDGPGSSENDAGKSHWAHRLRQQVRAQLTIVPDQPWLAILSDEVFVHLNDTNYPSEGGIDQNRLFVGAGYQASPALRAEVGYLHQYVRRFTDPNQINHVLNASLSFKLDFEHAKD